MNRDESIDQFRQAFEILHNGVTGFREFRLIDPAARSGGGASTSSAARKKPPVIRYFSVDIPAEAVYDWISEYFGVLNCYVGRAVRATGAEGGRGGVGGSVEWVSSASFDADARAKPANDADLAAVLDTADRLKTRLACGSLVLTGNGYQVWSSFTHPIDIRGRREWWANACKRFEEDVVKSTGGWNGDSWKIDPQYDIPRIVRLPGCPSVTGQGRYARIVDGQGGLLDPERIVAFADGPADEPFRNPLAQGHVPSRFWALVGRDMKLMESWSGKRADLRDTSGSGQDMALVARLRALRFDPAEALAILRAKPNKGRSTEDYCERTVRKAFGL